MRLMVERIVTKNTPEGKILIDSMTNTAGARIENILIREYDEENGKKIILMSGLDINIEKVYLVFAEVGILTGKIFSLDNFIVQEGEFGLEINCTNGSEKMEYYAIIDDIVLETYKRKRN